MGVLISLMALLAGCYSTGSTSYGGYYGDGGYYGHRHKNLEPIISGNAGPGFRTYTASDGEVTTCSTYGGGATSVTNCW